VYRDENFSATIHSGIFLLAQILLCNPEFSSRAAHVEFVGNLLHMH
jgi:hypothetical protein